MEFIKAIETSQFVCQIASHDDGPVNSKNFILR